MLCLALSIVVLAPIAATLKFQHARDTWGGPNLSVGRWLVYLLDGLMAVAGGVAIAALTNFFGLRGLDGSLFFLTIPLGFILGAIVVGLIGARLWRLPRWRSKLVGYACVLALVVLWAARADFW